MATAEPTRLLLTGLPPSLTLPLLRAHLSRCPPQPPLLTDLKILLKPDGTSRRIGFVGFKEHAEAQRVLAWVHRSWIAGIRGGATIGAEWAKETTDVTLPKKRSRVVDPPSPVAPVASTSSSVPRTTPSDEAARFAEFMSVMAPKKQRVLENLNPIPAPIAQLPTAATDTPMDQVEEVAADDEEISDRDYLLSRQRASESLVEPVAAAASGAWIQDELDPGELSGPTISKPVVDETTIDATSNEQVVIATINESSRLFVRNLAFNVTEDELRTIFHPFGEISSIHIPMDTTTQQTKGTAYITFAVPANALAAFNALDRTSFQGRLIHILPAVVRNAKPEMEQAMGERGASLKSTRFDAKKKELAASGLNWGSLFMNSDAVVASVADRLGISKATILDSSSDNTAVRVALAETHVIAETKIYFESEGVDLLCLSKPGPRSSTTILVKNIPYGTSLPTLTALFSPFGTISRLLVPPAGTIAIVEMENEASAKDAWRGCAYKKVGGSVLYLEKAPLGIWNGTAAPPSTSAADSTTPAVKPVDNAADSEPGSTLFIKNLSFASTTASLTDAFSHLPAFVFARVQTRTDAKKPGQTLSMGFGFVGFRTVGAAQNAMRSRQGLQLEGHQLEIKFAQRGKDEKEGAKESKGQGVVKKVGNSTKLLVKNVPFEVTRKEIRELFNAYGQLKSVRLPRKLDQKTRGFAFLEFVSHREAQAAFTALEHTHLLGRHLVLQWAEEGDETVENLRAKVGTFSTTKIGARKDKFSMGDGTTGTNTSNDDGTEG